MGKIVSAIRGGKASRVNHKYAIKLAKEQSKPLVFLYVVDPSSIRNLEDELVEAAASELEWFGEALLEVASRRAKRQGVNVTCGVLH